MGSESDISEIDDEGCEIDDLMREFSLKIRSGPETREELRNDFEPRMNKTKSKGWIIHINQITITDHDFLSFQMILACRWFGP